MMRLVMVNFKPGEYIKKMIFQSVTQAARKKENFRVLPAAVEPMTFWLPTSPDALSLSYRRLVDAKAIKLGWFYKHDSIWFVLLFLFSLSSHADVLRALSRVHWGGLRDEPKERLQGRPSWTVVLKTFADIVNKPIKRNISITQTSPLEIPDLIYFITKSVKTSGKERWKFLFISSKFTFFLTTQQNGSSLQSPWFVVEILLC